MPGAGSDDILYGSVGARGGITGNFSKKFPQKTATDDNLIEVPEAYQAVFARHAQAGKVSDWEVQEDAQRELMDMLLEDLANGKINSLEQAQALAEEISKVIYA